MYTPFRLKPRIFPLVVSATVTASEAVTVPRSRLAVGFVFGSASGVGCAIELVGKMTEPANCAPRVAMPLMKERRPLEASPCPGLRFLCTYGSFIESSRSSLFARRRLRHRISQHQLAAVHLDSLAHYIAGGFGGQKGDHVRAFHSCAHAAEGNCGDEVAHHL